MRTLRSTVAEYTLYDDGVVVARAIHPEIPRTVDTASKSLDVLEELIEGRPRPILWDIRGAARLQPEAWQALIGRLETVATALAVMADEETPPLLGAFPEAIDSLLMPVGRFDDEEAALVWLRGQLDEPVDPV